MTESTNGAPETDLSGRKVLVTGCNGFLGCHVAVAAQQLGAEVAGIGSSRSTERAERLRATLGCEGTPVTLLDRLDSDSFRSSCAEAEPDVVIHLAGVTDRNGTADDLHENIRLAQIIVAALAEIPNSRRPVLIVPGSQLEYGAAAQPWREDCTPEPTNPYGVSKLEATRTFLEAHTHGKLNATVARLPIVYGPGQPPTMFIPELIRKSASERSFAMTEGSQRRKFIFARDAALLLLTLADRRLNDTDTPSLLNAPGSPPTAMIDIAESLIKLFDFPVELQRGAIPMRDGEVIDAWMDHSRADLLGLTLSTPLQQGLEQTTRWYLDNDWFHHA